mgnify:CR=1 FL=1
MENNNTDLRNRYLGQTLPTMVRFRSIYSGSLHSKQLESCIAEKILERQNRKIRRLTSRGSPGSRRAGDVSPLIKISAMMILIFDHWCMGACTSRGRK